MVESTADHKIQAWTQTAREVARLIDGLGKRVDKGIQTTVTALRALGFPTTASCEGHLQHGMKAPWINIGDHHVRLVAKADTVTGKPQASPQMNVEMQEVRRTNLKAQERLLCLLERFYQRRNTRISRRLIVQPIGNGAFRLTNQGAHVHDLFAPVNANRELRRCQTEMAAFTTFLEREYVHGAISNRLEFSSVPLALVSCLQLLAASET
ncbi:MAG: hypothetical protein ABSD31_10555 [Candidatus Binataceae bacterium]|jgi:hypothetical protein